MQIPKKVHSFLKFQAIPLPATGLIFSILGFFLHGGWISLSFDIFSVLYNPLFLIFLGLGSFLYIDHFYMKKFSCKCHCGWRKKFHYLSGYVTGIMASYTFYLIPVTILFFYVYDSQTDVPILSQNIGFSSFEMPLLVGLIIFGFISRFITKEVFESIDGNNGILFNTQKTIPQQIQDFLVEIKNRVS